MLTQYKKIYPNVSYKVIYDTCIKQVEEGSIMSKEEKLYWYLWNKYSGEVQNIISSGTDEQKYSFHQQTQTVQEDGNGQKNTWLVFTLVSAVVLICTGVCIVTQRRRKRDNK